MTSETSIAKALSKGCGYLLTLSRGSECSGKKNLCEDCYNIAKQHASDCLRWKATLFALLGKSVDGKLKCICSTCQEIPDVISDLNSALDVYRKAGII